MEEFKSMKPAYSQACNRLYTRVVDLLMPEGELNPAIREEDLSDTSFPHYFSDLPQ